MEIIIIIIISEQLILASFGRMKYTKQVYILKHARCGDVDKVQVPAVSCDGNLVDIRHRDSVSGPPFKSPRAGHFLSWVSS